MKLHVRWSVAALAAVLLVASISHAEVRILSERTDGSAEFAFNKVPSPSRSDAATQARFTIVDGRPDGNGGGAEITGRNVERARYDGNYRISANFLNWVTETYDRDVVRKLNAAARERRYSEDLWKEYTGKTVQELGDKWKAAMQAKVTAEAAGPAPNTLTEQEKAAGWKLLFNGETLDGWHNFKSRSIRPGWQVCFRNIKIRPIEPVK